MLQCSLQSACSATVQCICTDGMLLWLLRVVITILNVVPANASEVVASLACHVLFSACSQLAGFRLMWVEHSCKDRQPVCRCMSVMRTLQMCRQSTMDQVGALL